MCSYKDMVDNEWNIIKGSNLTRWRAMHRITKYNSLEGTDGEKDQ